MGKLLHPRLLVLLLFLLLACWWQYRSPRDSSTGSTAAVETEVPTGPITPLPLSHELDNSKVALGEKLFSDPQLSHDDTISCSSCHSLSDGGADHRVYSIGIGGQPGVVNAPTVFNSGLNFVQFWDGRAATLEQQVDGPIQNPVEMGSNWEEITQKLRNSPTYTRDFNAVYPDGIQRANVIDAIATFERSLITPNSRFDRYLRGDSGALTSEEIEGYRLFKEYGCASCHQGANVGGNLFQKFGVMGDYFAKRGNVTSADYGRFNVTKEESDRYVFKVPSLRNIAVTAPYFHDGSAERLEDAVTIMSVYQLGRPLTPEETTAIVKYLKTLTGEYKGKAL